MHSPLRLLAVYQPKSSTMADNAPNDDEILVNSTVLSQQRSFLEAAKSSQPSLDEKLRRMAAVSAAHSKQ